MKELENLKELYLDEIKKINKKGELTPPDADAATKALEAIKKIDEICEDMDCCDDEYSERYSNRRYSMRRMPEMYPSYGDVMHMLYHDDGRYSERRGRSMTTGRYISRGNQSTVDHMIRKLESMKMDAPDHETRAAIDNVIDKLESY